MSFSNKVDYMPNQPFFDAVSDTSDAEHKMFQKRKWQVLIGSFLLVLIVSNAIIWGQSPVYQSQAILHFSYTSQTEQEFGELAQQQITLHKQRLKSNSILSLVAEELAQNHALVVNTQTLFETLLIEENLTGRIISLKANSNEPQMLKPILDALTKVYLQSIESETQVNNDEDLEVVTEQQALLEEKITNQQQVLELFALENNITSLERDENRVLSKTKNLGANLDQAITELAQAQALLNSLTESIESGQVVTRPADSAKINATRENLQEITATLSSLSEKFTQAYLERDSTIVGQQRKALQLEKLLEKQIEVSQTSYLQDTQRDLNTAKGKVEQLNSQLVEQNKLAQTFSQKLEQFISLDDELKALQSQAQILKSQQIAQEITKPFEAQISLIEPAYTPNYPIGPNYQLNSLISLIAAAIFAIFSLLLFSFIFKQKTPTNAASNFVVIPGQTGPIAHSGLNYNQQSQLPVAEQQNLSHPPAQLPTAAQPIRLLSNGECQEIFSVANNQGKTLIGLMLSGVSIDELFSLKKVNFVEHFSILQLSNGASRILNIQADTAKAIEAICKDISEDDSIWHNISSPDYFLQLLVNVSHDAKLAFPDELSLQVLRHTYLTYITSQGARLNDLEQVAGYTSPSELARYRNVNHQGKSIGVEDIQTQYPFTENG